MSRARPRRLCNFFFPSVRELAERDNKERIKTRAFSLLWESCTFTATTNVCARRTRAFSAPSIIRTFLPRFFSNSFGREAFFSLKSFCSCSFLRRADLSDGLANVHFRCMIFFFFWNGEICSIYKKKYLVTVREYLLLHAVFILQARG